MSLLLVFDNVSYVLCKIALRIFELKLKNSKVVLALLALHHVCHGVVMEGGVHGVTTATMVVMTHLLAKVGHGGHGVTPGLLLLLLSLSVVGRHWLSCRRPHVVSRAATGWRGVVSLLSLLVIDLLDGPQLFLELHPSVLKPDLDLPLR